MPAVNNELRQIHGIYCVCLHEKVDHSMMKGEFCDIKMLKNLRITFHLENLGRAPCQTPPWGRQCEPATWHHVSTDVAIVAIKIQSTIKMQRRNIHGQY